MVTPSGFAATTVTAPVVNSENGNNVDFVRNDLSYYFDIYQRISDVIAGSKAVKNRGAEYLPIPNPTDTSRENFERYVAYKTRAVFYGATKRTLSGYLGQVFGVDPVIKVPEVLNPVVKDANGSGVSLVQLAQHTETDVIAYGRAGLFVDYPTREGPTSREEQLSGLVRPTITEYKPWNIINWRTEKRGSNNVLTLVVLKETDETMSGRFGIKVTDKFRVLTLEDGKYYQEIFIGEGGAAQTQGKYLIRGSNGNPLDFIPFTFVGAIDNEPSIDHPPLDDLAELNIAHYRNSADYEDSVFMVGQPTPVVTGLTDNWYREVLKEQISLGSRGGIPLPEQADFKLVQAEPNSLAKEAMEAKEKQMVALGAKLVEQKAVQRTATEAKQDEISDTSALATITNNVSAAFVFALECASIFAGGVTVESDAKEKTIEFRLNTEFALATMSPEEIRNTIEAWQKDAITWEEMRSKLRKSGLAWEDDAKAQTKIEKARMTEAEFSSEFNDANNTET